MNTVLEVREAIYNHIEDGSSYGWTAKATHDALIVYCVAKDTVQDTAEALLQHRQKGFTSDSYAKDIERN